MIHLLIDYESIQPRHLETRAEDDTHVTVFVGAHQERLPFDFVAAMQALGARARYVKIGRAGKFSRAIAGASGVPMYSLE